MNNEQLFEEIANGFDSYSLFARFHNESGITLEAMKEWRSSDGFDPETGEELRLDGVAATDTLNGGFGGAEGLWTLPGAEIIFLEGRVVGDLYDGVVVHPEKVVARMTTHEFDRFYDWYCNER